MNNKTSITALMSAFGKAYHTEHTKEPIFADSKARELMTDEEYGMIAAYILDGMDFFAPDKKAVLRTRKRRLLILSTRKLRPRRSPAPHFARTN